MQTINLDISRMNVIPTLYAKQTDVGRKFKAVITDSDVPYSVAGTAVSVWYSGASGEGNYTDIGADRAISVSGNEITVELITQMLSNPGSGVLCLVINSANGDQVGTWNIPYLVEKIPGVGSPAAQEYFTAFSQAVQNLPYPDASLSLVGKAAEAAAVGAALAGKAPAGYGLGPSSQYVNSWNDALANGWYFGKNDSPTGIYAWGYVTNQGADSHIAQTAFVHNSGRIGEYKRLRYNGVFEPWECVNPMMSFGVEYRTTERYTGNPVYTKLIDCGVLPNTSDKIIEGALPQNINAFSVTGQAIGGDTSLYLPHYTVGMAVDNAKGDIIIGTTMDRSSLHAYVVVKYTKS